MSNRNRCVYVQALGIPVYWKCPFFNFAGGDRTGHVTQQMVLDAWKRYYVVCSVTDLQ